MSQQPNLIEFSFENTRFKCLPENVARVRATLEKMPKHKPVALSTKNLARQYPAFLAGETTTADYVARFNSQFVGTHGQNLQHPVEYACENYHKAPAMLDPLFPEVVEESNPDYIEPENKTKAKRPSAAQYRAACVTALAALNRGDTVAAQLVLMGIVDTEGTN
jgi:hypothetical protein